MSTEVQTVNENQEISFSDIMQFLKKSWVKIFLFAFFSFLITAILIVAAYFLLPKKAQFVSKINLQLQKVGEEIVYPSGKAFSANDIISIPVLRKVYDDNKLADKIEFDEFCQLFSLSGISIEKALLDASFRGKLSDKKISVVDLKNIEREYAEELRNLNSNMIEIAMQPTMKFNAQEVVKILNAIPSAWFAIFSKQEARALPRIETIAQIQKLRGIPATEGWLVTLDKTRFFCSNLQQGCRQIDIILAGQKVALPSGEYLEELRERLITLEKHRIRTIQQLVLENVAYRSKLDEIFLRSSIIETERLVNVAKSKYEATVAAINILHPQNENSGKTPAVSGDKNASVTMNFDANFFSSVSELIRDSQSLKLRETYAREALGHKGKLAELEAEKDYYEKMLAQQVAGTKNPVGISKEQFSKIADAMFDELLLLCRKVNEFRDLVFRDYLLDKQFFTSSGEVLENSSFYIPFARVAVGLFCLLLVINVIYIGSKFYSFHVESLLKK